MPKLGAPKRRWVRVVATVALVLVVLAIPVGAVAWYKLFREVPTTFATDAEHFKYGSIGNENTDGIPYPIWLVLPEVFPGHLPSPGGYESLGLIWEPGADVPIGFSKKTIGLPPVAINCAFCHTPVWRPDVDSPRVVAPGGASNTVDTQGYVRFLSNAASDPRFNADVLLEAIRAEVSLSWLDRLLYRYLLIPRTRQGLLEQKAAMAWTDSRPDWGPGRIDPFNPVKFGILRLADDGTIGNSDMQDVWNLDARDGMPLHWDGLNTSIREVVVSSAVGDGATGKHIDWASIDRIERFLRETKPPPFPPPPRAELAARGEAIFERDCAVCHGTGGERTGTVIPVEEVGTDRHRVDMRTDAARDAYNAYDEGYDWNFSHFQNVEGYVAQPLDGVWLRAPYLHNGSVPTLRDLFEAPERRPSAFYRGFDVFDPDAVGFVTELEAMGPAAESGVEIRGFYYDTTVPGNSNQGHTYGTDLPAEDKEALVEYLKTL
jgi:hypothetical protein